MRAPERPQLGSHQESQSSESFLRLTLRFEEHRIKLENLEEKRFELARQFRDAFRLGERNICFLENADSNKEWRLAFQEGVRIYNSFRKAYLYAAPDPVSERITDFSDTVIEAVTTSFETTKDIDPEAVYQWIILEILDRMRSSGYDIDVIYESSNASPEEHATLEKLTTKSPYARETLTFVGDRIRKRNVGINKQLVNIIDQARKVKQPMNPFVLLGTLHSGLIDLLPSHILNNTVASSETRQRDFLCGPLNSMRDSIVSRLAQGLPISETYWDILGDEIGKAGG